MAQELTIHFSISFRLFNYDKGKSVVKQQNVARTCELVVRASRFTRDLATTPSIVDGKNTFIGWICCRQILQKTSGAWQAFISKFQMINVRISQNQASRRPNGLPPLRAEFVRENWFIVCTERY